MAISKKIIETSSKWGSETKNVLLESQENKSLLVLFPGNGYHCDKPLLYYAQRVGVEQGCDVLSLEYGFQAARSSFNVEDHEHHERLLNETASVIEQVILNKKYEKISFISKSIGTVVAGAIGEKINNVNQFYITPLLYTMPYIKGKHNVVVGSEDPMFTQKDIDELQKMNCSTYIIAQVGHSLEANNIKISLDILFKITELYKEFLNYNTVVKK